MNSNKPKMIVGFSVNSAEWSSEELRILIKQMQEDEETDLYLISDEDTSLVDKIQAEVGMEDEFVIKTTSDNETSDAVVDKKCLIFLTQSQELVDLINEDNTLDLEPGNVTGCQGIRVNSIVQDTYKLQAKYITFLDFWSNQIQKIW